MIMKYKILLTFICVAVYSTARCQQLTEIARTGIQSTVSIISLDKISQPLGFGSGFIVNDELIVTNVHVVEGANSVYVLKNNDQTKYKVDGYLSIDKTNDLVLLKVSSLYGTKLKLSDGELPEIDERIYAVGNPKGLNGTFSEGIISGIRENQTYKVLQITAPISPGSSGGPVLNNNTEVVGVSFASFSGGQNLNFAIPVKYVKELISKSSSLQMISNIKPPPKSTVAPQKSVTPNIKEGLMVRNINIHVNWIRFSIKNNLPYKVDNIKILFLVYDKSGTVIDYAERTYFETSKLDPRYKDGIKPFLARSFDIMTGAVEVQTDLVNGEYVKARILDFRINEDKD